MFVSENLDVNAQGHLTIGGVDTIELAEKYGKTKMKVDTSSPLYQGLDKEQIGLMSHTDQITVLPYGFKSVAKTDNCPNASIQNTKRKL